MSRIEVRWASDDDRQTWLRLRHSLWPDCPEEIHRIEVEQALALGGGAPLAHHAQSGVIGFAEISLRHEHVEGTSSAPVAYLEGWFVEEAFRRQGVGQVLVEAAARWATERGLSELASDAELANVSSQNAHEALGFLKTGRSVHYVRKL